MPCKDRMNIEFRPCDHYELVVLSKLLVKALIYKPIYLSYQPRLSSINCQLWPRILLSCEERISKRAKVFFVEGNLKNVFLNLGCENENAVILFSKILFSFSLIVLGKASLKKKAKDTTTTLTTSASVTLLWLVPI